MKKFKAQILNYRSFQFTEKKIQFTNQNFFNIKTFSLADGAEKYSRSKLKLTCSARYFFSWFQVLKYEDKKICQAKLTGSSK